MTTYRHVRHARARVLLCALCAALACAAFAVLTRLPRAQASHTASASRTRQDDGRVDIRLRSLTTRATGKLTVEPSESGGRVRMTALNLPDPRTVTPGANTYVVWAVSGGRILRLGELKRDERGNGGLAFERPEGFDRYGIIVTAEPDANAERPGDPVLTTRADEATALYPAPAATPAQSPTTAQSTETAQSSATTQSNATAQSTPAEPSATPAPREKKRSSGRIRTPVYRARAGGFYDEVDDAIETSSGGRVVELEGDTAASGASGVALAGFRSGSAYVRANFRGVPLPSTVGAGVYVLWGVLADGRIVYMGSLPATEDLNRAEVYVRVAGFDANDYTLFVTAEPARPVPVPSTHRVLRPRNASYIIK